MHPIQEIYKKLGEMVEGLFIDWKLEERPDKDEQRGADSFYRYLQERIKRLWER